ncbi:MAG: glutathione peroxidase [Bacteriovorax sp.]|nr:glutathione peroxidase [Bacteriovorax sp.]
MKILFTLALILLTSNVIAQTFYDFKYTDTNKKVVNFKSFKGKLVLVVNIATRCGYTGQLDDIEKLYNKYESKNFVVVGFPSNDFGSQTPESNEEVGKFCKLKYGATFHIFEKQDVIGSNKTGLYTWLNSQKGFEKEIAWNFEKFLIGKDGRILNRFASQVGPLDQSITSLIEKNLN